MNNSRRHSSIATNPPGGAEPSLTERGIGQIHALLQAMASKSSDGNGDDADDGNAIAAAHPRVLAELRAFLQTLADHDAVDRGALHQ